MKISIFFILVVVSLFIGCSKSCNDLNDNPNIKKEKKTNHNDRILEPWVSPFCSEDEEGCNT